jgi:hypothetical protein
MKQHLFALMLDHFWTSNEALEFYSDSAGGTGSQKGFGIYFQGKWAQGSWPCPKMIEHY